MKKHPHGHHHPLHPDIIQRLKRASGHLAKVIDMLEHEEDCIQIAQQLHAVVQAVGNAKSTLVTQHIENCLVTIAPASKNSKLKELKDIAKYL